MRGPHGLYIQVKLCVGCMGCIYKLDHEELICGELYIQDEPAELHIQQSLIICLDVTLIIHSV